jgi:hypothetical protein
VLGDAHSLPSIWRFSDPSAEPLVLDLVRRPKMVDLWSIVGGRHIAISDNDEWRQEGDFSRSVR